jgi:hypothetical protein
MVTAPLEEHPGIWFPLIFAGIVPSVLGVVALVIFVRQSESDWCPGGGRTLYCVRCLLVCQLLASIFMSALCSTGDDVNACLVSPKASVYV